jgi:isoleucyl-tRNA synthetase
VFAELARFKGEELEGCSYAHPLYPERPFAPLVVGGDYITTETGARVGTTSPPRLVSG